jgi:hypothetical protein
MDWKFWITVAWIVCAFVYMEKEYRKVNETHSRDFWEEAMGNLKFWGKVIISPLLLVTGKW